VGKKKYITALLGFRGNIKGRRTDKIESMFSSLPIFLFWDVIV
jgi:hypothetical protein